MARKSTTKVIKSITIGEDTITLKWSDKMGFFYVVNGKVTYFTGEKYWAEDQEKANKHLTTIVYANPAWAAKLNKRADAVDQGLYSGYATDGQETEMTINPAHITTEIAEQLEGTLDYNKIQKFANDLYEWHYVARNTYMRTNVATDPRDNGKPGFIYAGSEYVCFVGVYNEEMVMVFDRNEAVLVTTLQQFMNADVTASQINDNKEKDMPTTPIMPSSVARGIDGSFIRDHVLNTKCINCSKELNPDAKTSWYHTNAGLRECMSKPATNTTAKNVVVKAGEKTFDTIDEAMEFARVAKGTIKNGHGGNFIVKFTPPAAPKS